MELGELIQRLKREDPKRIVATGFAHPHSYRGFYEQLAFVPTADISIGDMLSDAESALGETFQGWKGGDYQMKEYTDVWLANVGECGEMITTLALEFLLHECK